MFIVLRVGMNLTTNFQITIKTFIELTDPEIFKPN